MLSPGKKKYSIEDIYAFPEDKRVELIDGDIYEMAAPKREHQKIVSELHYRIKDYIKKQGGTCEVYPAPFAVIMKCEHNTNYFEPDISVICDKDKLDDEGCKGAPDFIVEVVSPSSVKMDYITKLNAYFFGGVREYWIVDLQKKHTTVYRLEDEDLAPVIVPFDYDIPVGIYKDLKINIAELMEA